MYNTTKGIHVQYKYIRTYAHAYFRDGHKVKDEDKDAYKRSVEYDTIAEATSIQGSPPAVSYAATTQVLSKHTNTGPALKYDYARTGPIKVRYL